MKVKKNKLFNLLTIMIGIMTCFAFGKVQAADMTSVFTGEKITRKNIQSLIKSNSISNGISIVPITLGISESNYKTNNGNTYWTIKEKDNNYQDIYCLNLSRGFGAPDGNITDKNRTKQYKNQYELMELPNEQYTNLIGLNVNNRNKIASVLNRVATTDSTLTVLLEAASEKVDISSIGLTNKSIEKFIKEDMKTNTRESTKITFDDVKMVQQIVVWHYTNAGSLFDNTIGAICDSNGNKISGSQKEHINTDGYGTYIWDGEVKQAKLNALYQYFINCAENDTVINPIPTLEISKTSAIIKEYEENDVIVGPIEMTGENLELIKSITESGNKNYTLLDSSKHEIENNDFKQVIGKSFYLKISKSDLDNNTDFELKLTYKYDVRRLILLTDENDPNNTQPVVIVESQEQTADTYININIKLIQVSVEKKWEDVNNQDSVRPTNIKVQLYQDGIAKGNSVTLSEENNWSYNWEKLLSGYEYTVKELDKDGNAVENNEKYNKDYTVNYDIKEDKITITNTHKPEEVSKTVIKVWDDNKNQDGKMPDGVTVELYADGEAYVAEGIENPVVLNEANNWKHTWKNLAKNKDGKKITYTVKELDKDGNPVENNEKYNKDYTATYDIKEDTTTITNTHILEKIKVSGTKTWEDNDNQYGKRPEKIIVNLYADGEKINSKEVKEPWTYSFDNLAKYKDGIEIKYTVDEEMVDEYSKTIDGYNITNKYTPGKTQKTVVKDWQDNNNQDGKRPDSIEVQLYKIVDGVKISLGEEYKVTLDKDNNWEHTWQDLDLKENGKDIIYAVEEIGVPDDYTVEYSEDDYSNTSVITIKNTYTPDKINKTVIKEWIDGDNEDNVRPRSIEVQLYKIVDGEKVSLGEKYKVTLNEANGWEHTWKDLDAKEAGKDIVYTVEEVSVPNGYTEKYSADDYSETDTIKITNTHIVELPTGTYDIVLNKVDNEGNPLTGAVIKVNGKEYTVGRAEIAKNVEITSENPITLEYVLEEIKAPEGYIELTNSKTIKIKIEVERLDKSYNIKRVNLVDEDGNVITDEIVNVKFDKNTSTISINVINNPIQPKFDLALRKFITQINDIKYSREPVVDTSTIESTGTATYKHIKQPIAVQKGDIVTYTIRVYNEGELDGYVDKITDHLPNNLLPIIEGIDGIDAEKYKDEIEFNSNWLWIMSNDKSEVTTTITSKLNSDTYSVLTGLEDVTDTKLDAYVEGSDKLDYIDIQIKCLVTDEAVRGEYLTNIAEITEAQDINGVKGDGQDSEPENVDYSNLSDYKNEEANKSTEDSYIKGQEDDDDFEKLVVKEFDLSLRKFITKVNETSYSRQPKVDASKLGTVDENGKTITTAIYAHSKEPIIVETENIVTYKIRIYNEGTIAGYANEITDDIPEGLEFLPNSSVNVSYRWKMLDSEENETDDVTKAVAIVTDYLSDVDKNNIIEAVSEKDGEKTLNYKDVEVQFRVVAKAEKGKDNIIINEAQISADSDRDIDSIPNRDEKYDYTGSNEDDIDYEPIKLQYFDLALRKFITKVNTTDYNNRYPEIIYNEDKSITYKHSKDPVLVETNDVVVYTIRVYNEGEKAGYATEVVDNLPEGLEFLPENEINKQYGWKLLNSEGNVTEDITKAVKVMTDNLKDKLIEAFVETDGQKVLSYQDVQIAFKVTESNMSNKVLVNTAEISKDSDDDIDSTPGNNEPSEDDIDKEYVKVEYFDLSLKKWVTESRVTYNGKTTITKTNFTEDTDEIAKVDLVASKMNKTTVKFAYKIKVTNEGEIPGYAYEVKDYIPKGLKFVQEDNKNWKEVKDGVVVTDQLKDTLLNPGESATVEIVLTWKNSTTNTGLKTNYAEISKDSGDDIDSTPDNFNKKEDDIDDAQVILSIKTAGTPTYVGLVLLSVAILAGGIFSIKKYVIK